MRSSASNRKAFSIASFKKHERDRRFAATLLERMGFELPVLFALPCSGKGVSQQIFDASTTAQRSFLRRDLSGTAVPKAREFRPVSEKEGIKKGPAVQIPSAPPTSYCELIVGHAGQRERLTRIWVRALPRMTVRSKQWYTPLAPAQFVWLQARLRSCWP